MDYVMYEIEELKDYAGNKEYSIYHNGQCICKATDRIIAESIKEGLEKGKSKVPEIDIFNDNTCPNCRTTLEDERRYCHLCGQRIRWGRPNVA